MTEPLVGTTLDRDGSASHSGFIDIIDLLRGVRGWAVNLADPQDPVLLQLCIGHQIAAETLASGERSDISDKLGMPALAAFTFGPEAMVALHEFLNDPDDVLSVRVAATGHHLSTAEKRPSAGDILAWLRARAVPETAASTQAELSALLESLQAGAAAIGRVALRPLPESLQGYLESVAVEASGQVWFMGWMKRGHVQEFSAVVEERGKYPAAVAVVSYAREDLPAEACGVIGLIASAWRPSSASHGINLFFGANGRFHLRSHDPLRILTAGELMSEYEGIRDRCFGDGRATTLQRMLTATENWLPTRNAGQWYGTETSIDRVLLVPGLGCLVEGWVVSPMKRIETLRLRVGASVMSAHPDNLYWKPRLDLLEAFPGSERMVRRAGFVGLFTGDAEPEDFADPMLKIVFHGGESANWSVPPRAFRRLGHSASVEDALMFFPALQDEAFFPAFAQAAIRAERGAMNPIVTISLARSRRAVVVVLPEDRCDTFLLFEEVAQQCRTGGGIEALTFIAAARSNRSDALWLFREFQATQGNPRGIACSLLVIDDASQAFDLLPEILRQIGASRFLFIGAGVFLTEAGWKQAQEALAPGNTDLVFFGIEAEAHERRDAAGGATARCFAWSSGNFARWSLAAPAFMGGFYKDNALLLSGASQVVHTDAARATRGQSMTRIREAVNESVYAGARPASPGHFPRLRSPATSLAGAA